MPTNFRVHKFYVYSFHSSYIEHGLRVILQIKIKVENQSNKNLGLFAGYGLWLAQCQWMLFVHWLASNQNYRLFCLGSIDSKCYLQRCTQSHTHLEKNIFDSTQSHKIIYTSALKHRSFICTVACVIIKTNSAYPETPPA